MSESELANSIVCTILKNIVCVKEAAKSSTNFKASIINQPKDLIYELETFFAIWFVNKMKMISKVSQFLIQTKAPSVFEKLVLVKHQEVMHSYPWFISKI